jgi:hypothetical protein
MTKSMSNAPSGLPYCSVAHCFRVLQIQDEEEKEFLISRIESKLIKKGLLEKPSDAGAPIDDPALAVGQLISKVSGHLELEHMMGSHTYKRIASPDTLPLLHKDDVGTPPSTTHPTLAKRVDRSAPSQADSFWPDTESRKPIQSPPQDRPVIIHFSGEVSPRMLLLSNSIDASTSSKEPRLDILQKAVASRFAPKTFDWSCATISTRWATVHCDSQEVFAFACSEGSGPIRIHGFKDSQSYYL